MQPGPLARSEFGGGWAPLLLLASACATACASPGAVRGAVGSDATPAVFDACWPEPEGLDRKVTLQLAEGPPRSSFTTEGGANNSVGRCAQEVAQKYPWPQGRPGSVTLQPPLVQPDGWTYLAYAALLAPAPDPAKPAGLVNPGPLVRACLESGPYRPYLRYRVQPTPTRVSGFIVVESRATQERSRENVELQGSAERCVAAVLSAAQWPGSRSFELSFPSFEDAPPSASPAGVAMYFRPVSDGAATPEGKIAKQAFAPHRRAMRACFSEVSRRRPGMGGVRTMKLQVAADGRVVSVGVLPNDEGAELQDYLLDQCLAEVVQKARLSTGGPSELAYSWVFEQR